MNEQNRAVYDAALEAAARLGQEHFDGDLGLAVLDSPEVAAVLPKWGVGDLPPTFFGDLRAAYEGAKR